MLDYLPRFILPLAARHFYATVVNVGSLVTYVENRISGWHSRRFGLKKESFKKNCEQLFILNEIFFKFAAQLNLPGE
ncbi:MAG: hypothetical protein EOM59_12015 [Clostridia bacterium]|nr:hypothetical protein [Clostridia bacterium]